MNEEVEKYFSYFLVLNVFIVLNLVEELGRKFGSFKKVFDKGNVLSNK